ncbi:dimethylhistidine N-methyltransferase [Azorhizobium oxalatiphilum]|uniref:Dimethylhistidine N-methyltransferase n=1 Tax=Azorhizobium oxalatiphilum TaxID=980631 RepID=A0A917C6A7_9HYPH|nr:L-histidine N(alpha)-methyltransferase [Azorhizobium oxalatiphilum]GGF72129.1 dimethylhistidine N-methyltransferase [Azorhizobium oxalatiphilum]
MPNTARPIPAPATGSAFASDLAAGLSSRPKRLAPKYFYDAAGSALFEDITALPEYYPTRTEMQILRERAGEIGALVPQDAVLVEFGSGSSAKVRLLLEEMPQLAAYVPVDISGDFLEEAAQALRAEVPGLPVLPVAADFTQAFDLPQDVRDLPRIGFFPGSTIGNFDPDAARDFLGNALHTLGPGSRLIVGVDLVKDPRLLNAAYNDAAGVTARFNLNLLTRANRELGTDFDPDAFAHRAFFNAPSSRIEMHLVSRSPQAIHLGGRTFPFAAGESLHTESSYKYTPASFAALARSAGWTPEALWTDRDRLFSVHVLRA